MSRATYTLRPCPICGAEDRPRCPHCEAPEPHCDCWHTDDDDDSDCYWCAGEGWSECDDPIQCTKPHHVYERWQECPCSSCGGSGLSKDMTIW
jgi:hypothetical protein